MSKIIQGSTYTLSIEIFDENNNKIDIEQVEKIEFSFDMVQKYYPEEVFYNGEGQFFIVPLSQEDTLKLKNNTYMQYRVKFLDGQVKSTIPTLIRIQDSISKVIL